MSRIRKSVDAGLFFTLAAIPLGFVGEGLCRYL